MSEEIILIIKRLEEYEKAVDDILLFVEKKLNEDSDFGILTKLDSLIVLIRDKIYPYINKKEILNKEFQKRAHCYELKNSKEFKKLFNELYDDINKLHSMVNKDVALQVEKKFFEDNNDYYFYDNCVEAIKSLKMESIYNPEICTTDKSYYTQLIELIKNKNNYHNLNLYSHETCKEFYKELINGNLINHTATIKQFRALEKPINNNFVNKVTSLVKDINRFKTIKQNYFSKVNELSELLEGNFRSKRSLDFCIFKRFVDCCDMSKIRKTKDIIKCDIIGCFQSVKIVLTELREFAEDNINLVEEKNVKNKQTKTDFETLSENNKYSFSKVKIHGNKTEIQVAYKNGVGFLQSLIRQKVFEYLLSRNNEFGIKPTEITKACGIKSDIADETLKKYIQEINTMLRDVHCIEGRKQYITIDSNGFNTQIPL